MTRQNNGLEFVIFLKQSIPCWNSNVIYQPGVTTLQVKNSVEEWKESIIVPNYKNGDKRL